MRREPPSTAFPAAAVSAFAFAYIALPLACWSNSASNGKALSISLSVAGRLGRRHLRLLHRQIHRPPPHVPARQPEENLGRRHRLGARERRRRPPDVPLRAPISTALLLRDLIERSDGIFNLEKPALIPIIALSVVLNIAAQLGDLVESLIKRGANVKDSGSILPGHGGMFDRIDALLFAAPVLWLWAAWRVMH